MPAEQNPFAGVDLTANDAIVAEMREWLSECEWADIDADEIATLPANRIIRAVARYYEGGIREFIFASA